MKNHPIKSLLLLIAFFLSATAFSQTMWDNQSFALTRDQAVLEQMGDATMIEFHDSIGMDVAPPVNTPGFSFKYGLDRYQTFYVTKYGWIKFGEQITSRNPVLQTNLVCAMYAGPDWDVSYKLISTGNQQKLVIQYDGVIQPTGEPTKYQIWLYENGKIEFVYEQITGFYQWGDYWQYKIFCKKRFYGEDAVASVPIPAGGQTPVAVYSNQSVAGSIETIYPNTRLSFSPDTIKPAKPSAVNINNLMAGCFTININDQASNETALVIQRADNAGQYKTEKILYADTPSVFRNYAYNQTKLQPDSTYNYRVFASNGFSNSDTILTSVHTPMPMINGIKKVPGDYSTITALLQDASCKHLGPELVIELQNNYSFASEKLPLIFNKELNNRLIKDITVRPAAGANITMSGQSTDAMIYVDSIKHLNFDGRPGGTGAGRALTLVQKQAWVPVLQYTNGADSALLRNCIVKALDKAVLVTPYDRNFFTVKRDVDALRITNCDFTSETGYAPFMISITPAVRGNAKNIVIDSNYFSQFSQRAILLEGVGDGAIVSANRFYEKGIPPIMPGMTSCISAITTGNIEISGNYIGGSSPEWGKGLFVTAYEGWPGVYYSAIDYENDNPLQKASIRNNFFGNIRGQSMIYAGNGDVDISDNRFGTLDSSNSIASVRTMSIIQTAGGTKKIRNNFFSGIQTGGDGDISTMIYAGGDSVIIENNDIGGKDDNNAIVSSYNIEGIGCIVIPAVLHVNNNKVRGLTSKAGEAYGITYGVGLSGLRGERLIVNNNDIHHIESAGRTTGIRLSPNGPNSVDVTNNRIYALKTRATRMYYYMYLSMVTGIDVSTSVGFFPPGPYHPLVTVSGNRIHSFESLRVMNESLFEHDAILVVAPASRIYNNEVRFGYDAKGKLVDALTGLNGIVVSPSGAQFTYFTDHHLVEHNSFYFGGTALQSPFIKGFYEMGSSSDVTMVNNIFALASRSRQLDTLNYPFFDTDNMKVYQTRNIWYSPDTASLKYRLNLYQQQTHSAYTDTVGDPHYENPAGDSSNFSLKPLAFTIADGTGIPSVLNIEKDIVGNQRTLFSPVDIGAYAITPCDAPAAGLQLLPTGDSVQLCNGQIKLTASVAGSGISSLQWQKDLIDITGAKNLTLLANTPGQYRITGKNACGTLGSRTIVVTDIPLSPSLIISKIPNSDSICKGNSVTFNADIRNLGDTSEIIWFKNGISTGVSGKTWTSAEFTNSDAVYAIVRYTRCGTRYSITSDTVHVYVRQEPSPLLSILSNTGSDCSGRGVGFVFKVKVENDNYHLVPEWRINEINTGIHDSVFAPASLHNADKVDCVLKLTTACVSDLLFKSNVIVIAVDSVIVPTVSITPSKITACGNDEIVLEASAVNGGVQPLYQWKINDFILPDTGSRIVIDNVGTNSTVTAYLTSSIACAQPKKVSSNVASLTIKPVVIPAVTINAVTTPFCNEAEARFTSTLINGGTTPMYHWTVNSVSAGNNSAGLSINTLKNGDIVALSVLSNADCADKSPARSNAVVAAVLSNQPSVSISGNTNVAHFGKTTITAKVTNAGNPLFEWQDSTSMHNWQTIAGLKDSVINYTPMFTGDKIRCRIESDFICSKGERRTSDALMFTVTGDNNIVAFPNPVTNKVTISVLPSEQFKTLDIFNSSGLKVPGSLNIEGKSTIELNLTSYTPGIYLVVVYKSSGEKAYARLLKQ